MLSIVGMVNQNSQTASANANNAAQQTAEVKNAQNQATLARNQMAPWLQKGASPLGNATVGAAPGALALGAVPGQGAGATQPAPTQVMQPPGQPAQAPQPRRMPQAPAPGGQLGQPAAPQPRPQLSPTQVARIQQIMHEPATLNTTPVAL